jgi:hypothetical protein
LLTDYLAEEYANSERAYTEPRSRLHEGSGYKGPTDDVADLGHACLEAPCNFMLPEFCSIGQRHINPISSIHVLNPRTNLEPWFLKANAKFRTFTPTESRPPPT